MVNSTSRSEKILRIITLFLIFATLVTFHSWAIILLFKKTLFASLTSPELTDLYLKKFIYIQFLLNFLFAASVTFAVFLILKAWYGKVNEKLRHLFEHLQILQEKNGVFLKPETTLSALISLEKLIGELRQENEKLQEKLRFLSEEVKKHEKAITTGKLASSLVHELSGPLSAVKNYLKEILSLAKKDEYSDLTLYTESALESLKRIERITEDLRHVGRAGLPRKREDFHPSHILRRLAEDVKSMVGNEGVVLKIQNGNTERIKISGDPELFYRIFKNLVENAVKACEEGQKSVNVEIEMSIETFRELTSDGWYSPEDKLEKLRIGEGQPVLALCVRDNGQGIPPARLSEIFNPFVSYRAENGGTGLGLFVVREGVKSFGGRIFVKSREGEGTEFKIYIPLRG